MKTMYLAILTFFFLVGTLNAQWVNNENLLTEGDDIPTFSKGLSIAVDDNSNCYIAGYCYKNGSADNNMLVIKYSPAGKKLWLRKFDGGINGDDKAYGIVVDELGFVYVVGTATVMGKSKEICVLKYDNDGNLLWMEIFGETSFVSEDEGLNIVLSGNGNVFVTGYTSGNDEKTNIFIRKFNPSNTAGWFKIINNPGGLDAKAYGIITDELDNVYITGYSNTSDNSTDIIIAKYSSKGNPLWIEMYDEAQGDDCAYSIGIDQEHNAYVAGYVTCVNQNIDCALLRFNSYGSFMWIKKENGNGNLEDKAYGIVVDEINESVIYTGFVTMNSDGMNYITSSYKFNGGKNWTKMYDGPVSGSDISHAIELAGNGCVIITGESDGIYNDKDYASILYDNTGKVILSSRYSMNDCSDDRAMDVAVSQFGNAYITGTSELLVNTSSPEIYSTTQELFLLNVNNNNTVVKEFKLTQNYPNPFNPSTNINFSIGKNARVVIKVYDILGRFIQTIADKDYTAGTFNLSFDGQNLSSGTYFYEMTAGDFRDIKKMILIK